ncbi:serine hydrolase [Caldovatus aquaticus]|uniref:Uncharacterized protein n=1 Tax=Caldovatus aquaticus TaxID=2865671 RepID=A0ABS7F537_9PROT|nr:hypothetical protein [Caldovatus aquaticus]MBW8269901.1 hypothetical protein [Caldovatus aquaticus]
MPPPVTPPIPLFPVPTLGFAADAKLQGAVTTAVAELNRAGRATVPFSLAIVDLGGGSGAETLKWGAHKPDEEHYVAGIAKVAAMYGAFALLDMVRRFAAVASLASAAAVLIRAVAPGGVPPPAAKPRSLFDALRERMDPAIDRSGGGVLQSAVRREHRVPHYEQMLVAPRPGVSYIPAFRGEYREALKQMIVPSSNEGAGRCIRGIGYGYLNGALEAAGLFDAKAQKGIWLAGDFVGLWPYARIESANDGAVAQAGTALAMAKCMAMIVNRGVLDAAACDEMRTLLAGAASGPDQPFLTRTEAVSAPLRLPLEKVTHAKLGLGPLKKGGNVLSEAFRLEAIGKPGKSYAVAYQNLDQRQSSLDDVAFLLRRAIEIYER